MTRLRAVERRWYGLKRLSESLRERLSAEQLPNLKQAKLMSVQVKEVLSSLLGSLESENCDLHVQGLLRAVLSDLFAGDFMSRGLALEDIKVKKVLQNFLVLVVKSIPIKLLSDQELARNRGQGGDAGQVYPTYAGFFGQLLESFETGEHPYLLEAFLSGVILDEELVVNARVYVFWHSNNVDIESLKARLGSKDKLSTTDQGNIIIDYFLGEEARGIGEGNLFLRMRFNEPIVINLVGQGGQLHECAVLIGSNLDSSNRRRRKRGGKRQPTTSDWLLEPAPAY